MAGHLSPTLVGNGNGLSWLILNVVPAYLVATLGITCRIRFTAEALTVDHEFHLVGIGIGDELQVRTRLAVPMVGKTVVARLHTIPHLVATAVDHGDVNKGLVGLEHTLHQVGLGLWFERDVEHALCPALGRPALRFAQIVDGAPVGQADDFVKVHLEEVRPHSCHSGFALIERHPGETASVAREVHVAIVVGLHIGLHGQVARQRVRLPVAVARVHGNGDEACGVVALQHGAHHLITCHTKVVEWLVGVLLQLIA